MTVFNSASQAALCFSALPSQESGILSCNAVPKELQPHGPLCNAKGTTGMSEVLVCLLQYYVHYTPAAQLLLRNDQACLGQQLHSTLVKTSTVLEGPWMPSTSAPLAPGPPPGPLHVHNVITLLFLLPGCASNPHLREASLAPWIPSSGK